MPIPPPQILYNTLTDALEGLRRLTDLPLTDLGKIEYADIIARAEALKIYLTSQRNQIAL